MRWKKNLPMRSILVEKDREEGNYARKQHHEDEEIAQGPISWISWAMTSSNREDLPIIAVIGLD